MTVLRRYSLKWVQVYWGIIRVIIVIYSTIIIMVHSIIRHLSLKILVIVMITFYLANKMVWYRLKWIRNGLLNVCWWSILQSSFTNSIWVHWMYKWYYHRTIIIMGRIRWKTPIIIMWIMDWTLQVIAIVLV